MSISIEAIQIELLVMADVVQYICEIKLTSQKGDMKHYCTVVSARLQNKIKKV